MSRPVRVLWNPAAGRADPTGEVRAQLAGRNDVEIVDTVSAQQARRAATEAATTGARLVVAAGGDGTVSAVARGLLDAATDCALALLPIGTANDLARTLCVPPDPEDAIALWDDVRPRRLDVVRFETADVRARFVNVATGGNSARIHDRLTPEIKEQWGPLCYVRSGLGLVSDLVAFEATVELDDGPPERMTLLNVIVANARYAAGGLAVAPAADPEDGLLDVVLVRDGPTLDLASTSMRLLLGNWLESELVVHRRARRFRIGAEPAMGFSVDGDVEEAGDTVFEIERGVLPVAVGATYRARPMQ